MKNTEERTLNELCRELQVSRRAVQGYEKYGLVKPTGKTERGYLLYDPAAQEQIRIIHRYQQYGFQLKEIQTLLEAGDTEKKQLLSAKRMQIARKQVELAEVFRLITEELGRLENREETI